MTFYEEMQETAIELFEEFGTVCTLQSGTGTEKGKVKTVGMKREHATKAGLTISDLSKVFYISPESKVQPEPGDILTVGKQVYTLKHTMDLTPDAGTVMYYLVTGA